MRETDCGHQPHCAKGLCRKCYRRTYEREKDRERLRKWQAENREKTRESARIYAAAHRAQESARAAAWRAANPERVREAVAAWHRNNRDRHASHENKRRALKTGAGADLTGDEWLGILAQFDHRCFYCGTDGPMVQEHMTPLSRGGRHSASNVVPACRLCNGRKFTKTAEEFLGLEEIAC